MERYVLDASAILALIKNEKGADIVKHHLKGAVMSSVNYSEVVAVLARKMPRELIEQMLGKLISEVVPFDGAQAVEAGILYQSTKEYGLSLGDRACLTLANILNSPVLTSDAVWQNLQIEIEVKNIRT